MKDLTIILEDRPGTFANLGEALGRAGVNIDGLCAVARQGKGEIHILVENAGAARAALEGISAEVSDERDVLVVEVEDKPGELGNITRKIADAGVNINLAYLATRTRLVLGVDDLEKAQSTL